MSRAENTTYLEVKGTFVRETEKAFLFKPESISGEPISLEPGREPAAHWFPFSQVNKFSFGGNAEGNDWFMGSEWILNQKNLL